MDDIVHTFGDPVFLNAWSVRVIVSTNQRQNHRYQSSLELHLNLLGMIFPFHKKPTFPKPLFSHVAFLQTGVQFHPESVQVFFSILQKLLWQFALLFHNLLWLLSVSCQSFFHQQESNFL